MPPTSSLTSTPPIVLRPKLPLSEEQIRALGFLERATEVLGKMLVEFTPEECTAMPAVVAVFAEGRPTVYLAISVPDHFTDEERFVRGMADGFIGKAAVVWGAVSDVVMVYEVVDSETRQRQPERCQLEVIGTCGEHLVGSLVAVDQNGEQWGTVTDWAVCGPNLTMPGLPTLLGGRPAPAAGPDTSC